MFSLPMLVNFLPLVHSIFSSPVHSQILRVTERAAEYFPADSYDDDQAQYNGLVT